MNELLAVALRATPRKKKRTKKGSAGGRPHKMTYATGHKGKKTPTGTA